MPRRRPGTLLPLELAILDLAVAAPDEDFHGFAIARRLADDSGRSLTAHGTLYKALTRMAEMGLLESHWEEPEAAEREGRPRRRLYRVTAEGAAAAAAAATANGAARASTETASPATARARTRLA
ncbi:PadR family transcriptional regulator [Agromyces mangrovi Wang et al. 2018]|uniref:PadR family transcriptional regulator n=1 Tax=Agromyces mangrovi TaxID=1858653 RepID=UPI002573A550|nr:PadR family transcriptional regulator [Agromyces mangrovi]BDZ65067.1 hypothetical protein GCM10025877_20050 [Agromyces mangrovi]